MTQVIVQVVSSVFALAGVIITVAVGNKRNADQVREQASLTLYRIKELEEKQEKHNTLIERMYRCEDKLHQHAIRIDQLEKNNLLSSYTSYT